MLPVLDYNKRIHKPSFLGGELAFNVNLTHLTRDAAAFSELPRQKTFLITTPSYSLFDGCAIYQKDTCLVRGLAGNIARATAEVSWRRNFIDPIGQVWTPYASLRADIFSVNPNTTGFPNSNVTTIADTSDEVFGRAMPAIGLMYRYPLVAKTSWGTHIIEPVAQIVARPNETNSLRVANEDAQSLVFDANNLFEWSGKFSGYDRVEGGTRANVGALYTGRFGKEGYANLLLGQSYQVAGSNSFASGDLVNTGLEFRARHGAVGLRRPRPGLALQGPVPERRDPPRPENARDPAHRCGGDLFQQRDQRVGRLWPLRAAAQSRHLPAPRGPVAERIGAGHAELAPACRRAVRPRQVQVRP